MKEVMTMISYDRSGWRVDKITKLVTIDIRQVIDLHDLKQIHSLLHSSPVTRYLLCADAAHFD
jgi:hypothetical protein